MDLNTRSVENFAQRQQITGPLGQSVLLVVVIVLIGWFLVKPAYSAYQERHTSLQTAKQQLSDVEKDKADLDRLVSQLHNSEQDVKITDEALPLNGRISKLDVLINSLATTAGMQVTQIDVPDSADTIAAGNTDEVKDPFGQTRSLQTTKANVFVSGNIDQFRNFLQLLETSGRIIDVSGMNITTGEGVTRFQLTLKAYAYEVPSGN